VFLVSVGLSCSVGAPKYRARREVLQSLLTVAEFRRPPRRCRSHQAQRKCWRRQGGFYQTRAAVRLSARPSVRPSPRPGRPPRRLRAGRSRARLHKMAPGGAARAAAWLRIGDGGGGGAVMPASAAVPCRSGVWKQLSFMCKQRRERKVP